MGKKMISKTAVKRLAEKWMRDEGLKGRVCKEIEVNETKEMKGFWRYSSYGYTKVVLEDGREIRVDVYEYYNYIQIGVRLKNVYWILKGTNALSGEEIIIDKGEEEEVEDYLFYTNVRFYREDV